MTLKELSILEWQKRCSTTKMPPNYVPKTTFTDKTANGLTKCITTFLNLKGHQAERINTMGRVIDNTKFVTDSVGFTRRIGSTKYIPTTGTKGSADISATINGRSVKIEIKMKDVQSDNQKKYQADIERAGGVYFIARNWEQFLIEYNKL